MENNFGLLLGKNNISWGKPDQVFKDSKMNEKSYLSHVHKIKLKFSKPLISFSEYSFYVDASH